MIIPEWLFKEEQAPVKNKFNKVYNPKTIKQISRENDKKMTGNKIKKELKR